MGNRAISVNLDKIDVHDPVTGEADIFSALINSNEKTFVLVTDLHVCDYCIGKGMKVLLDKADEAITAVLVCDDYNENVLAWSVHYPGVPVFRGETGNFIANSTVAQFPLLLEFEGHELVSYKIIEVQD